MEKYVPDVLFCCCLDSASSTSINRSVLKYFKRLLSSLDLFVYGCNFSSTIYEISDSQLRVYLGTTVYSHVDVMMEIVIQIQDNVLIQCVEGDYHDPQVTKIDLCGEEKHVKQVSIH